MTIKKHLIALAAATTLAAPSMAQTGQTGPSAMFVAQPGLAGTLMALLLPAVQKVREAARR